MLRNLLLIAVVAFTLPACATLTTGTTQSMTVVSEPTGATCELQREGATIAVVNPTPGTVQISKSSRDMMVRCTRRGYSPGVASIASQAQAMVAGNILIGGVIGLGIDAASGALSQYPTNVTVALLPQSFASAAERDAFFATRVVEVHRTFAERSDATRSSCPPGTAPNCAAMQSDLAAARDAEVARLEALRGAAVFTQN